jgi:hypothetical protein
MAVNRRARRRSPRLVLLAGVATLLALVINASVHSRPSSADSSLAFYDQIRPEIQHSTAEGADLADVRANALKLGRDGITRSMDRLLADSNSTLAVVSAIVPPPALRVPAAYLVTALGVRARAASEASAAMANALAVGPSDPAVDGLVTAGQDLELGDRAYTLFLNSLPGDLARSSAVQVGAPSASGATSIPVVPDSKWATDASVWTQTDVSAFVTTLRSSTSLIPIHDMAVVTFTTDPAPVAVDNGAEVLPASPFQVAIVVADVGNTPEKHVTVTATLVTAVSNTTEMVRDFVDVVPGQRIAIKIGSLHPLAGTAGTLTVATQPVPGETNLQNSTLQWAVAFR